MSGLPELMPLEWIEPKRLNSNVMRGDRYENTKHDIELNGIQEKLRLIPKDVYTGDSTQPHDRYVIEDGNQRYRIAQELGIEAVPYEVVERGELDSLAQNYRHQANRGEQDPLIEAEMFQHYLDQKLTQEEVVEELGLRNRYYLTDRIALMKLSEEVRETVADLPKVIEYRVRQRMYGEPEEEIRVYNTEIVGRPTISLYQLRAISTLSEADQMHVINAMLDTFIEGGTVTTRQVADRVKLIKENSERLHRFSEAWKNAKIRTCPTCNTPPLSTNWDEEHHTFTCAKGHQWRYDKTPEEVAEEQAEEKRRLDEEQRLKDAEEEAKTKERGTKIIEDIIGDYSEPLTLTLQDLVRRFYILGPYGDFGQAKAAVLQYLNDHPDTHLAQPPTPEELDQKREEDEKARRLYLKAKLEQDTTHLQRIIALYNDVLTRKQLYTDYMELSRTIRPQDARDIISLYLEAHPEVTFPGDEPVKAREPDATDRAISAALGQPPMPEEQPRKGRVYYTIKVEELEEDAPVRQDGCRFGYSYDTGQGGGAGPIRNSESFPDTVKHMVKAIWMKSREMASYPRPTMRNTVVEVCKAAADEGLITEAEIWNALITHPLNEAEEKDNRPKGDLCDGCTEDCYKCPHEDEESDEDLDEDESLEDDRESDDTIGRPPTPAEPPSITLIATAAELHQRIVPWIMGKIGELSDITSIHLEGLRDKEEVLIEYAEPDWKGRTTFGYRIQTTTPIDKHTRHVDTWKWLSFNAAQQMKGLKLTSGKLGRATQEDLDQISQFLNDAVYTDLDPWDDPDNLMGPTGFTMTPVDSTDPNAASEPCLTEAEAEAMAVDDEEEPADDDDMEPEALPVCPECGKESPNSHYCTSCGTVFNDKEPPPEPEEAVGHGLTENEEKWLGTGVKKLGKLAHRLTTEEVEYLKGAETRTTALNLLSKRRAEINLANAPTPTLQREAGK